MDNDNQVKNWTAITCVCGSTMRERFRQNGQVYAVCPTCDQDEWIPVDVFDKAKGAAK